MTSTFNKSANCLNCGYQLHGLPDPTCPECGRAFDFDDPSTYDSSDSPARWRKFAKPPSGIECTILCVYSLINIAAFSGPARIEGLGASLLLITGSLFWPSMIAIYLKRVWACYRDRNRARHECVKQIRRRRWFVLPLCVLLLFSMLVYPWPLMIRFKLSQNAFNDALKYYQAGKFAGNQWIGLYYVERVETVHYNNLRSTTWFITGDSIGDPVGFEYDPLPNHPMGYLSLRVGHSWYVYED